jgi:S-adenosylmethionine hydrolase
VGSDRRAIAVGTLHGTFVAPDNGVLSWALADQLGKSRDLPGDSLALRGTGLKAVSITNPTYWRSEVSATFHARDIFGPVAAHLSLGVPIRQLGKPIHDIQLIRLPRPEQRDDGSIVGHIVHVDRFGTLITDLTQADIAFTDGQPQFEVIGRTIDILSHHYAERRGLLALIGSSGQIEIASSQGSAAEELRVQRDDVVVVRKAKNFERDR